MVKRFTNKELKELGWTQAQINLLKIDKFDRRWNTKSHRTIGKADGFKFLTWLTTYEESLVNETMKHPKWIAIQNRKMK